MLIIMMQGIVVRISSHPTELLLQHLQQSST